MGNKKKAEHDPEKIIRKVVKAALKTKPQAIQAFYKAVSEEIEKPYGLDRWTLFNLRNEILDGLKPRTTGRIVGLDSPPDYSAL